MSLRLTRRGGIDQDEAWSSTGLAGPKRDISGAKCLIVGHQPLRPGYTGRTNVTVKLRSRDENPLLLTSDLQIFPRSCFGLQIMDVRGGKASILTEEHACNCETHTLATCSECKQWLVSPVGKSWPGSREKASTTGTTSHWGGTERYVAWKRSLE